MHLVTFYQRQSVCDLVNWQQLPRHTEIKQPAIEGRLLKEFDFLEEV